MLWEQVVAVVVVNKKSIHIKLDDRTHLLLKDKLSGLNLSMQEVVEYLSQLIINDNDKLNELLNNYIIQKVEHKIKLSNKDKILKTSDIFAYIAQHSPLNREK